MKMMKRISAIVLAVMLSVPCFSMVAFAADGSISFTDPETKVGETVEIKCAVRTNGNTLEDIEIHLSYDTTYLQFESGDGVTDNGEGSLTYKGTGSSSEATFTMNFQALAEGSGKVSITDSTVYDTNDAQLSLDQGDSTVTIGAGDPSKIEKKEAQAPSAGDMQVEVDGTAYTLTDKFADADIPAGYSKTTVSLEGQEHQMVMNEAGTIYLAYLLDAEGVGSFFIYNQDDATFWPYEEISISEDTSIVVLSDTSKVKLPENYMQAKLTLNEKEFPVWQDNAHDGYYIIYAMNSNGEPGYYQYHEAEGTYQRVEIAAGDEKKEADDSKLGKVRNFVSEKFPLLAAITGIIGFIVLVLIIVLAVKLRNRNLELDDLYDEYGIDLEDEEPELDAKAAKSSKKSKGKRRAYEEEDEFDSFDLDEDEFEDDFEFEEEDDFDEEDFDEEGFDEDDFVEDDVDEDDDIFSEKKLSKYDTVNIRREAPVGGVGTEDDLDELLGAMSSKKKPTGGKKKESFNIDFIDLD